MTSVMQQTIKVKFNDDHFTSLQMKSWSSGYSQVGFDDLMDTDLGYDDSAYLAFFLTSCVDFEDPNCTFQLDDKNVLSVKANENGVFERVYGPIILASEDESSLVMRCGNNIFPIDQIAGGRFQLGLLVGDIETSDLEITDKTTQQKRIISIPRIDFKLPSDKSIIYCIPILTKEGVDGEALKEAGRDGENITPYLRPVKSGSSSISKLNEMEPGEYQVTGIDKELKTNDNGAWTSYTIHLQNGKSTWVNQKLRSLLDGKYDAYKKILKEGRPVTLSVSSNVGKNGTTYINASLLIEKRTALPSAPVAVKSLNPDMNSQQSAIDVKATVSTEEAKPDGPIPF